MSGALVSILLCSPALTLAQDTTSPSALERTIPKQLPEKSLDVAVQTDLPEAQEGAVIAGSFVLGAVLVSGATVFTEAQLAADYEPYLATEVDDTRIRQIVARITERYRSAGYALSYAILPPQDVRAGILRIDVIEGQIEQIEVVGAVGGKGAFDAIAAPLLDGQPLRTSKLERVLGLMRDLPGYYVADVRIGRSETALAKHQLTVTVIQNPVRGVLYGDNRGTVADARARIYSSISLSSLMRTGDDLRLSGFSIPGSDFRYLYAQGVYALPIGRDGWLLQLSGSYGDQYQVSLDNETDGASRDIAAELSYPVVRSRALTAVAKFSVNDWLSVSDIEDVRIQRDRLRVARAGLSLSSTLNGQINFDVWISRGLGFNAATQQDDPISSQPGAGARFTKVSTSLQIHQPIAKELTLRLAAAGQLSSGPLLSIEEFALGGSQIGRAFDFNSLTGDHGIGGSLELGYLLGDRFGNVKQIELFSYLDGGAVFQSNGGTLESPSQSLASAGGGARFSLYQVRLSAELGVPIEAIDGERAIRAFVSLATAF